MRSRARCSVPPRWRRRAQALAVGSLLAWLAPSLAAAAPAPAATPAPPAEAVTLSAPAEPAPAERRFTRQVAPGIRHVQIVREPPAAFVANLLFLDPARRGWRLQAWPAKDALLTPDATKGREAVGKLATRRGAVAAINGDFFPFTGDPLGLQITDGEVVSEPYPGRSAFGITRDGRSLWGPVRFAGSVRAGDRSFPIHGINRARKADELVLYTPRYAADTGANAMGAEVVVEWLEQEFRPGTGVRGTVSEAMAGKGAAPIPAEGLVLSGHGAAAAFLKRIEPGDAVVVRVDLAGEQGQNWNEAWQAIGGGPRLLSRGAVAVGPGSEGFRNDVLNGRAPRSAVGVTGNGEVVLAAVDGRQWISGGLTLGELAAWLRSEGVVDAINLDGGGSTTLSLRQLVVNSPSDGSQRLVANALLVLLDGQPQTPGEAEVAILAPPAPLSGAAVAPPSVPDEGAGGAPAKSLALASPPAPKEPGMPSERALTPDAPPVVGASATLVAAAPETPIAVPAGTRLRFRAARRLPDGTWQEAPEDRVTWGLEGMPGRLEQDGAFLGVRAGAGSVACSVDGKVARVRVVVVPGAPAQVTAVLEPSANGTAAVRARVVDGYGNGVPNVALTLAYVTGDGPQAAMQATDVRGEARVPLPLGSLTPRTPVAVSAPDLPPAAVKLP
ncbi:MAG: phosphodiester glycosidase family protein [Armatimonadetes bacterium]|nr:phosphodiester glycosidase family protein [Armatimonadota bacterium]